MRETVPSFLYSTLTAVVGGGGGGMEESSKVAGDGIELWKQRSWSERKEDK
jgi:hypothetical protein